MNKNRQEYLEWIANLEAQGLDAEEIEAVIEQYLENEGEPEAFQSPHDS